MIEIADIEAAALTIAGLVRRTPLVPVDGTPYFAKCESLQATGSFKLRGASNAIAVLRPAGVVTDSSGNHGHALALAAQRAGIPCTVVMNVGASPYKRGFIEALGARVVEVVEGSQARADGVARVVEEEGLIYVPPYNHPLTMAGQGTVGLELIEDAPDAATVVVPLGGGGLISGVATAVKARAPSVRVVGVEPEDGDDFVQSLAAGRIVAIDVPHTICDGARTQSPGTLTFEVVKARVDEVINVTDAEAIEGMRILSAAGIVAEPTGALGLAGALRLGLAESTVIVVSGRNIAPADYARYLTG